MTPWRVRPRGWRVVTFANPVGEDILDDMTQPEPTFTSVASSPTSALGPSSVRLLLDASHQTAFSVMEMQTPPGFAGPPIPHRHTREEAAFIVIDGAIIVDVAGHSHRVDAGGLAHLPRGVDFTWRNASDSAPARFLCVYAPAGFERMFGDVQGAFVERGLTPSPAAMREIMPGIWQKYGITPAKP
jgi:quercetin dioxygenase-like cupin family protein